MYFSIISLCICCLSGADEPHVLQREVGHLVVGLYAVRAVCTPPALHCQQPERARLQDTHRQVHPDTRTLLHRAQFSHRRHAHTRGQSILSIDGSDGIRPKILTRALGHNGRATLKSIQVCITPFSGAPILNAAVHRMRAWHVLAYAATQFCFKSSALRSCLSRAKQGGGKTGNCVSKR